MAGPGNVGSAKVIDIRTGENVEVTIDEYIKLLDRIEQLLQELRNYREDQRGIEIALSLLKEFRWNAAFNKSFRDQTAVFLRNLGSGIHQELIDYGE